MTENDLLVIDKGVHEKPLLYEAFPLRVLSLEITVRVIGHNDAIRSVCQLDNEAVVIADHPFASDAARRCKYQTFLPLKVPQNVLVFAANEIKKNDRVD